MPAKPKKLPETDSKKNRRYFEHWERVALIEQSKSLTQFPWLHTAIVISLQTGIRPNSLFHLRWSDIDINAKTLHLDARWMKTKDEWKLTLNEKALSAFKCWRKKWQAMGGNVADDQYIFTKNTGLISEYDWRSAFATLCKKCNINNCTWYNMRHDFASQLVMLGVSLITVRDLMCHKSIQTTQVYAHLAPDLKSAAVERLAKL